MPRARILPGAAARDPFVMLPAMSSTTESERQIGVELLARVAAGEVGAFTELYHRFAPGLYGLALRMMNDASEAEDVLQEGFHYIWRRASSFDPERSSPFAWAVMIVRHKAIDKLRIRHRFKHLAERVTEELSREEPMDADSADEPLFRDRRTHLVAALRRIPDEQREAVELAFFRGLTHEEIAQHLATPLGTVKARIRRGLLRLRDCLKEAL